MVGQQIIRKSLGLHTCEFTGAFPLPDLSAVFGGKDPENVTAYGLYIRGEVEK